jgi:cytochrome c
VTARHFCSATIAAVLFASGAAQAPRVLAQQDGGGTLIPGKGSELTQTKCAICHEIQHVTRSRLSRAEWEDNIKVMIARGMPITPQENAVVLDYLATYYSRTETAPPPDPAAAGYGMEATATAAGDSAGQLASASGCLGCHAPTQRVVGPSFREIAQRYAGDGTAATRLTEKIRAGGVGVWGQIPMPPHPQLNPAQAGQLARWILASS